MAKAKAKTIMVLIESLITGHKYTVIRERLADKLELVRFDPYVRKFVVYKELKKVRSMK